MQAKNLGSKVGLKIFILYTQKGSQKGILCWGCRKILEPMKENMDPNLPPIKQMKGLLSSGVAKGLIE